MTTTGKRTIGVIGLGLMGTAFSERLLEHGYNVIVQNRTREKADRLVAQGAQWSDNPLVDCDRVIISLFTSEHVREVLQGLQGGLRPGQILIDTTTGDPRQTAALGEWLAARGVQYLETPFSGSSQQTRDGEATALVAGPSDAYQACGAIFDVICKQSYYVGTWGDAARMKLVTNLVLGLNRAALAEGLSFARAIGLDGTSSLEVLRNSAAYSKTMDNKGQKMLDGDFSTQAKVSQHLKDVRLILDLAADHNTALPLSTLHRELLERVESWGYGDEDNSAIFRIYDGE